MTADERPEGLGSGMTSVPDRTALCISSDTPGLTLHGGDDGFASAVARHYSPAEAIANEKLCRLKRRLANLNANLNANDFWSTVMEGITDITGSQYALAVRRILPGEDTAAVEMPYVGDPGQCLMATAFFYNDGQVIKNHVRDYKYYPYSGPCSHMKHDKVFIVPANLASFVGDEQLMGRFAFPVDSYIGIPLFSPRGECIGHFGALWSEEGMKTRGLGWAFVEMALHALEDVVANKLLEGQAFSRRPETTLASSVIPAAVLTAAQSLKPYARSLSHELRTPMQGVVGMLDIMHSSVSEALEKPLKPEVARTFRTLLENIEVVQDSSHRAVEAADNVVHAADLDMQVPETPDPIENEDGQPGESADYLSAGRSRAHSSSDRKKRKLEDQFSPPAKYVAVDSSVIPPRPLTPRTAAVRSAIRESSDLVATFARPSTNGTTRSDIELTQSPIITASKVTRVREHIRTVVNECLRFGGRPDSAIAEEKENGEVIEARSRDEKGQISIKKVEWVVDPQVPDEIQVDERDFIKLTSVLLLNALKFTQHGSIKLSAYLGTTSRLLVVSVVDTGTGIPTEFLPNLFKAFSRQDDTITRHNDGLGLGLLVAKGIARKLGGIVRCVRSDIDGPNQGSEFEFRVPMSPSEASSRPSSPSRTPTPSHLDDSMGTLDMHRSTSTISKRESPETATSPTLSESPVVPESTQIRVPAPKAITPPRSLALDTSLRRGSIIRPLPSEFDRHLAQKHPLRFLVAEDNRLNRKLLVTMLGKLGYTAISEAFDGAEAVRLMEHYHSGSGSDKHIDVILMDLWMPNMDGYEATRRILDMERRRVVKDVNSKGLKILAVTADVTDGALDRAKEAGMTGFMTKPYKMMDLEKLIVEHCAAGA